MEFNLWNPFGFDLYSRARHFIFLLPPDVLYEKALRLLKKGHAPRQNKADSPSLRTRVFGFDFPNPIGLAAGFDTKAQVIEETMALGFGAMEIGTVPLNSQLRKMKPPLFLLKEVKAFIHTPGTNTAGLKTVLENLTAWHDRFDRTRNFVSLSLGPNRGLVDPCAALIKGMARVAPLVHAVTIHAPSQSALKPSDVKYRDFLSLFLKRLMEARAQQAPHLLVLLKISPDLTEARQKDIAAVALDNGVHGIIVSGSTASRPSNIPRELASQKGGLSGGPLFGLSTRVLSNMYRLTKGKIPLVGCGGVMTGEDAYTKIRAGASLVQLHAALFFEGPLVVQRIKQRLAELLQRDGFASVAEAVGVDHKS